MGGTTALRQLVGGILLIIGFLMTLCCGLCTGWFGLVLIGDASRSHPDSTLVPFLAIGAVATLVGLGLTRAGIVMMRK